MINPFLSIKNNTNNFINPFLNNNSNTFTSIPFNNTNNNNSEENSNEEDDDNESFEEEEEIKIEKNENNLFKEVKYENNNKFYEVEVENVQYLDKDNKEKKYVSVGEGVLSLEKEKNKEGKKNGILVLRDISTKNVIIQGIIISSSVVEKNKLKNGVEYIMIKNILAIYTKYNIEKIIQETKLTYLRIKVGNKNELDNLFEKIKEFFELINN